MLKIISVLLFGALSGCMVQTTSETYFLDQLTFTRSQSRIKFKNEFEESCPRKAKTVVMVSKDAFTLVKYQTTYKTRRDKQGTYYVPINRVDTIRLKSKDSSYIPSERYFEGKYIPAESDLPRTIYSFKGVDFKANGTCIKTWITYCNDSPCSTTHKQLGRYKYVQDTLHITYFGRRNTLRNNGTKTVDKKDWQLIEPVSFLYSASQHSDTIFGLRKSEKWNGYPYLVKPQ